jgi:hypothetical protein
MFTMLQIMRSISNYGSGSRQREGSPACGFNGRLRTPQPLRRKSQQFSIRVQTPGCADRRAVTTRAMTTTTSAEIPPGLTLNNTKSRQITVTHASFSGIFQRPFAGADQANHGNRSGATGPFRRRNRPKVRHGGGQPLHWIAVDCAGLRSIAPNFRAAADRIRYAVCGSLTGPALADSAARVSRSARICDRSLLGKRCPTKIKRRFACESEPDSQC